VPKDWAKNFVASNNLIKKIESHRPLISVYSVNDKRETINNQDAEVVENSKTRDLNLNGKRMPIPTPLNEGLTNQKSIALIQEESIFLNGFDKKVAVELEQNNEGVLNNYLFGFIPITNSLAVGGKPIFSRWFFELNGGLQFNQGIKVYPSSLIYEETFDVDNIKSKMGEESLVDANQGYGLNVGLGYSINEKWDLTAGIKASFLSGSITSYYDSEVTKFQRILTTSSVNNEDGTKSFSNTATDISYKNYFSDTLSAKYRLTIIELPIAIRYNLRKTNWNWFISMGVSGVMHSRYTADYYSNEIGSGAIDEKSTKLFGTKFNTAIGMEYHLTKDISLQLSPQYGIGASYSNNQLLEPSFSSFGIYGGVKVAL
jgi:hypothetical protein